MAEIRLDGNFGKHQCPDWGRKYVTEPHYVTLATKENSNAHLPLRLTDQTKRGKKVSKKADA